jgi:hypothetical protein
LHPVNSSPPLPKAHKSPSVLFIGALSVAYGELRFLPLNLSPPRSLPKTLKHFSIVFKPLWFNILLSKVVEPCGIKRLKPVTTAGADNIRTANSSS